MRKITLIIVAMMCVMTSCASSNDKADNGDKVTRTLQLTGFSGIDVPTSVRLKYTQSDKYSVKVTATERRMKTMDIHVKNGMLCVDVKPSERGNYIFDIKDGGDVEMEVSSPQLSKLNVSGNAEIFLSDISIGSGFSVNNSGNLAVRAKSIKAKGMSWNNSGNIVFSMDNLSGGGDLTVSNSGNFILGMKDVKARKTEITNSGNGKLNSGTIEGTSMNVKQSGAMAIELAFKGDNVSVDNSGNGNITLDVKCNRLRITNSGAASLEVSGTADDVKISGSGVSNVDNSKLNKF